MTSADRFASQEKLSIAQILSQSENSTSSKVEPTQSNVRPEWMKLTAPKLEVDDEYLPNGYPPRAGYSYDITHKVACQFLLSLNAFSSVAAMKVPGSDKLIKFTLPSMRAKADHQMWEQMVKQAYIAPVKKGELMIPDETKRRYFEYVKTHIATNGTLGGLVWRIKQQLPSVPARLSVVGSYATYLMGHFILDPMSKLSPPIPEVPDFNDEKVFMLTLQASAGFPFIASDAAAKTDKSTLSEALQLADMYIKIIKTDDDKLTDFITYLRDHPVEQLLALKRKNERMAVSNYWLKVRPYFVFPLALKLLFLWTSHYLEEHIVPFWDDYESNSAYKFSWFYGGAQKIVDLITTTGRLAKERGRLVFKAICFGDDQYWIFCLPNGDVIIYAPDVKGMDMSCSPRSGVFLRQLVNHVWNPPLVFKRVLQIHMVMAFTAYVHVAGAFQVMKGWGLNSGVPATTIIDIFNSVCIHGLVDKMVTEQFSSGLPTSSELQDFLKTRVIPEIKRSLGFSFKEETLNFQVWKPGSDIELPFLGMLIKFDLHSLCYYPAPAEPEKLAATLCLPTESGKHISSQPYAMERMYGALLSGAWTDPFLDRVIREAYSEYSSKGQFPNNPGDLPFGFGDAKEYFDVVSKPYLANKRAPPLPLGSEIFDMLTMSKVDFVRKYISVASPRGKTGFKWEPKMPSSSSSAEERSTTTEEFSKAKEESPRTRKANDPFSFDFSESSDLFKDHKPVQEKHIGKRDLPRPSPIEKPPFSSSSLPVKSSSSKVKKERRPRKRDVTIESEPEIDFADEIEEEEREYFRHMFTDDVTLRESERKLNDPEYRQRGGIYDDSGSSEEISDNEEDIFIRNLKSGGRSYHASYVDSPD